MLKGLLGKKIGMTQHFTPEGNVVTVTLLEVGPCTALQVKKSEKDGYVAVQLGFDEKKEKSANKPELGHFKKTNSKPVRFIKEVDIDGEGEIKPGSQFFVDLFEQGDFVDISGLSIGKGFQGGMKRWNWAGGRASHGSRNHRRPGSIGSSAYPARVIKGHRLPGHMGHEWTTTQNLEVKEVDKEKNIMAVKGSVPGPKGNYLIIRKALKRKKLVQEKPKADESSKEESKKPAAGKQAAKGK